MRNAIYAGSFDPLTYGHLWMIQEGAKLFDSLMVVVADNPGKKTMFTAPERVRMIQDTLLAIPEYVHEQRPAIPVVSAENGFMVSLAMTMNAQYLVRGLRTAADFEYERSLRHVNQDVNDVWTEHDDDEYKEARKVKTVFLMPPRDLAEVSSSLVKSLVGLVDWDKVVGNYVPGPVLDKLREHHYVWNVLAGAANKLVNLSAPIIELKHADLEDWGESPFRKKCPSCEKGVLPVCRDQKTYELLRHDRCVLCGQAVKYTDETILGQALKG